MRSEFPSRSTDTRAAERITRGLNEIRLLAYDHNGAGGLPVRPDVMELLDRLLATGLFLGAALPEMSLGGDGTVELVFVAGPRSLFLTVQCVDVISYIQILNDQTSIDGTIRLEIPSLNGDLKELSLLLHWLRGAR